MSAPSQIPRSRFSDWVSARPFGVLGLLLAVSLLAAWGASKLRLDQPFAGLLEASGRQQQMHQQVAREFGADRRMTIILRAPDIWSPEKLQIVETLHQTLQQMPFVERVDDLFTSPTVSLIDGQLHGHRLLQQAPRDHAEAERAKARALEDPIAARYVAGLDGASLALILALGEGTASSRTAAALDNAIAPLRGRFSSIELHGLPRVEAELEEILKHDFVRLWPGFLSVLFIVLALLLRSPGRGLLAISAGTLGAAWTLGIMGIAGYTVTLLTPLVPVISTVVAVLLAVRMFADRRHGEERAGSAGMPGVIFLMILASGCALAMISSMPIVRQGGLAALLAVVCGAIATVLLVPVAQSLGFAAQVVRPVSFSRLSHWCVALFDRLQSRHALALTAAILLAPIFWLLQVPQLQPTQELMDVFRDGHSLQQESQRLKQGFAGQYTLYITLDSHQLNAFHDPSNLNRIAEIQSFAAKQGVFDRSVSLADLLAQANQAAAGGRSSAYQLPATRKLVGEYLMIHSAQVTSPYISRDGRRANIVVHYPPTHSSQLIIGARELREAAIRLAGPEMAVTLSGDNLLFNDMSDAHAKQSLLWTVLFFALAFLVISTGFTSAKGGAIALIPALFSLLVLLALLRGQEIPLTLLAIFSLMLAASLIIEATLSLYARYSEFSRNTPSFSDAAKACMRREMPPLLTIHLALAACMGLLSFSSLAPLAQFGALASLACLISLPVNLLVIPFALTHMRLVGLYEILVMTMEQGGVESSPLFHGMSSYQIRKTILISELRHYKAGRVIIEQDTSGRSMYLVVSGQLDVVRRSSDEETVKARLGPGDLFGEIGFVRDAYRSADVRAVTDCSLLRFDHDRIRKDLMLFPFIMAKLIFNISGILGERLAKMVEQPGSRHYEK